MPFTRIFTTTMATLVVVLVAVIGFASMEIVQCDDHHQVVKGSVQCVDCSKNYDYSGIKVQIKCDSNNSNKYKPLVVETTKKDGSYEAKLTSTHTPTSNCEAKILGGPNQLYASKKSMTSKVVAHVTADSHIATASTLPFATSCSRKLGTKCSSSSSNEAEFGESKTINLPIPPEYGLAPSSYYVPIMPIIGIP